MQIRWCAWWLGLVLATLALHTSAQDFVRRDVTFKSQGIDCAAWYYVPADLKPGERRPAIVMAHGWSAVKEMFLDAFAERFSKAGFVVLVFDYRHFGASAGEPRQQIFWYDQQEDYRNALTWVGLQPEVDASRLGAWGSSFSGGHVLHLAAFDRRIKAVVAQVPATNIWESVFAPLPVEAREGALAWQAQERIARYTTGATNVLPVVATAGQPSTIPMPEAFDWFTRAGRERAPSWRNQVTVESLEKNISYDGTAFIQNVAPTPLLMIIASDDIVTPTPLQRKAFDRAVEPKKLVVVSGRHFDAYDGPKHEQFVRPAVEWFRQWLKP